MKQFISCSVFLFACSTAFACNVCGGSAGNQYLGLLPQQYKHFIGLQYQQRAFLSEHPVHGESSSTFSNERYSTMQVWGRTHIGQRFQVLAFVPYVSNVKTEGETEQMTSGPGDVSVLVNYNLVLPNRDKEWQHFLQAGAGLKMPTGRYDQQSIRNGTSLANMQAGTRSWDYSVNANYTLRNNKIGLNTDVAYTRTSVNPYEYKYGNKLNAGLIGFYQIKAARLTVLPQVGAKADIAGCDYDNYKYKWKNDMTGGQQLYATAGVQAFYGQLGFQCQYSKPLYQNFADGLVKARYKVEAGIYFLF